MLVKKLSGLIVVASALTITACSDNSGSFSTPPILTTPTQPPVTSTLGDFTAGQVRTLTCVNGSSVEINSITFTDSEALVDVAALNAGCLGGPAT